MPCLINSYHLPVCVTGQSENERWSRSRSRSKVGLSESLGTCRSVRGFLAAWLGHPEKRALLTDLKRKERAAFELRGQGRRGVGHGGGCLAM